jgi:hypothetical protein
MRTVTAVCALAVVATPVVTAAARSTAPKRAALDVLLNLVITPPPLFVIVEIVKSE